MTDLELPVVDPPAADDEGGTGDDADASGPPREVDQPGAEDGTPPELPLIAQLARTTGLLLVVLVPIHLGTLLVRDPDTVDPAFLIDRWSNPAWLLADWGLLAVGTAHAVLSLWVRVAAPGARPGRMALGACLAAFTVALFFAASWGMLRLQ